MKAFKISLLAAAAACLAIQGMAADAKSTISLGMSGYIDSNYNFDVNAKNGTLNLNQVGLDITASDSSLGIMAWLRSPRAPRLSRASTT